MEPVSPEQLSAALTTLELRVERRLGAIEADIRELKAKVVQRDGPIIDELRDFETRASSLESELKTIKDKNGLLSKAEIVEIARGVFDEEEAGGRTTRDYLMRATMFAVSLGTLIFVSKGGV